jgi:hypothetical protein
MDVMPNMILKGTTAGKGWIEFATGPHSEAPREIS